MALEVGKLSGWRGGRSELKREEFVRCKEGEEGGQSLREGAGRVSKIVVRAERKLRVTERKGRRSELGR